MAGSRDLARHESTGERTAAIGHSGALPGESVGAQSGLDAAVVELNGIYAAKGLETAQAIGEAVLGRFFGGDAAAFRGRSRGHVTFRQLGKRADLQMSYSFVWKSVAVAEQLRVLPQEVAAALPLSHHVLLLPVKDVHEKLKLARLAAEEGLARDDFEAHVRAARRASGAESKAGRPPLPAFIKAFRRLAKLRVQAVSEVVDQEALEAARMAPAEALVELEKARQELQASLEVVTQLEAQIEDWD